jgi:Uma2 family endonuclease
VLAFHADVQLSPHDILEPDLCFVSNERAGIIGDRLLDGAPDLVIEVLSPSTRRYDLVAKRAIYATHGVREYWIVDPETKTIRVLMFERGQTLELTQTSERVRSIVLTDLELRPADVFR